MTPQPLGEIAKSSNDIPVILERCCLFCFRRSFGSLVCCDSAPPLIELPHRLPESKEPTGTDAVQVYPGLAYRHMDKLSDKLLGALLQSCVYLFDAICRLTQQVNSQSCLLKVYGGMSGARATSLRCKRQARDCDFCQLNGG